MRKISKDVGGRTLLLGIWSLLSVLTSTNVHAGSGTCFEAVKLEPSFIAFTSNKDSQLGAWYQSLFGLEIAKEFSSPDGAVTGVLMHKGDFIVEVFYREDLLQVSDPAHEANSSRRHGVLKVGVFTDANLLDLQQCLTKRGVNAGRIFDDEKLGISLLQVTDPEENTVEIISRVIR